MLDMSLRKERDVITPYKISILLLIEKYGSLQPKFWGTETDNDLSIFCKRGPDLPPKERKATCMLISNLIHGSECDIKLQDLIEIVENSLISTVYTTSFITGLQDLYKNGIEALHALFDSVEIFCMQDEQRSITYPCLWTSIVGLHLRQLNLAFRRLSFSHILSLYHRFQSYYEECYKNRPSMLDELAAPCIMKDDTSGAIEASDSRMDESEDKDVEMDESLNLSYNNARSRPKTMAKKLLNPISFSLHADTIEVTYRSLKTRQQAELFIQEQICLLLQQSPSAISAPKLQEYLCDILKTYPDLGKGHFLNYLNCLRSREHAGAIDSLVRAYDSKLLYKDASRSEDGNRTFRYAALNMACLQARFGHNELALTFLKESIRLAQESSDHVCLQYALAWLYTLSKSNKLPLMKRSHIRSAELNLSYLTWLSLLNHAVELSRSRVPPVEVIKNIVDYLSSASHNKHTLEGNIASQASLWGVLGGLWAVWGNTPLASVCSQLVLHMSTQVSTNLQAPSSASPSCVALCNLALILANSGEFALSSEILQHSQNQYPSTSDHSKSWMFTQYYIAFYESLRQGLWSQAKSFCINMATVHPNYARLLEAELLVSKGEYEQAYRITNDLRQSCLPQHENIDIELSTFVEPEIRVKSLLMEAEALSAGHNPGTAVFTLLEAIALAHEYHMIYLKCLGHLQMSVVQMNLGLLKEALNSFDKGIDVVLSGGGVYDHGRAKLLQAKLQVCSSTEKNKQDNLYSSAVALEEVCHLFSKMKATNREKESIYLKARFYHECGKIDERNRTALEFRQLEQKHPSTPFVGHSYVL